MLFPSVQRLLLWYLLVPGRPEWKGGILVTVDLLVVLNEVKPSYA
jgi:hypothetical protein